MMRTILTSLFSLLVVASAASATPASIGRSNAAVSPAPVEATVWLRLRDRSTFDALVASLYDARSPNYRKWLTFNQIAARFGPSAYDALRVRQFLARHGMRVVRMGPGNLYVRAGGSVAAAENAFHTRLGNVRVGTSIRLRAATQPQVDPDVAAVVTGVSGLEGATAAPLLAKLASNGASSAVPFAPGPASAANFWSPQCFLPPQTKTVVGSGTFDHVSDTFAGNQLNLPGPGITYGCSQTPQSVRKAYGLTGLYGEGYNGTGQTVAILLWCGASSTLQSDANVFSLFFGLPQLVLNQNFFETGIGSQSCTYDAQTDLELHLDVEWAHAVAPGAWLNVVKAHSNQDQDIIEAEIDTIAQRLGTVISGSFAGIEGTTPTADVDEFNVTSEFAAASGISTNFGSGDYGDYFSFEYGAQLVSTPADSPYATAIGGETLALNSNSSVAWESGWGNNVSALEINKYVEGWPLPDGFSYGSGGGVSNCVQHTISGSIGQGYSVACHGGYAKPGFQGAIAGKWRSLPDVSWLADPTTGVLVLSSSNNVLYWQPNIGGTSVATPMFSALWAIANQESADAGGPPLGQAAPYLYKMPAGTIQDIVPVGSSSSVTAAITQSGVTTTYSPVQLMAYGDQGPANAQYPEFLTAFYNISGGSVLVESFGADCGDLGAGAGVGLLECLPTNESHLVGVVPLQTAVGWDDVTGVGRPIGKAFADAFH